MTLAVAVDAKMLEVTVWTRGVTHAKEARDTATLLAKAGKVEGKYVQSFDNYVDLPDRINVPVKSYARLSPEPIETYYEYENYHPDIVVLAEEALIKGNDILKGAKDGCVVIVNTARKPETLVKWLSPAENKKLVKAIACVDANAFSVEVQAMDGTMEGSEDYTAKIGAGVGAALAGAVARVSGCVKVETLESIAENKRAVRQGYEKVTILPLNK